MKLISVRIIALFLSAFVPIAMYSQMKTWWFFGYEKTSDEGIDADLKALKKAGFGGVVYYDQTHAKNARANGADEGFSMQWWNHLKYAASKAHRMKMTFEINVSNGYVAGGSWIDPQHAMQRVASADTTIEGGRNLSFSLPVIASKDGYAKDIALLAFPVNDRLENAMRHITARYQTRGKGRSGAMQIPGESDTFMGAKYEPLPDIGMLQVSNDSIAWRDVVALQNMYSSQGGYNIRTNSFPPTEGRYWRIDYYGDARLKEWRVGADAMMDRWEEKAALHSDFNEYAVLPEYSASECVDPDRIINLSDYIDQDGFVRWEAPEGRWRIVRLTSVLTGAKTKHGRQNLLGYECDKLSIDAALLHWNSYAQVIIDSLNRPGKPALVSGVTMDSHEGGSQNWTPNMLQEFQSRRGYDLKRYMLVMAGYIVESTEKTEQVLRDLRQTIAECIRDNYYGTFQRKASENGLHFTAQAIGNALCITGDAISVKSAVEKPQGEFWTYQQTGAYDVKDCSSAAHLYGKKIASAEAMTDAEYKDSPLDIKRVADIAFSLGAQEFVVCATPHIPYPEATTPKAYVAGREYAINRSNPQWKKFRSVWKSINHSMQILQQGKAAPDVLIFLGDDIPVKTLTHKLPKGIDGLDWDVCTGDALQKRLSVDADGCIATPDSVRYKALIIESGIYISPKSQVTIENLRKSGATVLTEGTSVVRPITFGLGKENIVHTHRIIKGKDVFFVANTSDKSIIIDYRYATDNRNRRLRLKAGESRFIRK